jgi:monoamine oxidase
MGRMVRVALQAEGSADLHLLPERRADALEQSLNPEMNRSVSRRDFLKGLAGAAGVLAMTQLAPLTRAESIPLQGRSTSPVVIVGGGLGGLVTAYRLTQKQIPCVLYEGSRRLGGRVYTKWDFNPEGMFVELGGELVDTGHEDLIALCQQLGVPLERFATGEPGIEPAIYFSGGTVYTEADVLAAFQPLARILADDIRRCFPDGVVQVPTYQQPFLAAWLDRISLEDYLNAKPQVAPWLIRLIKVAYAGEYGLDPHEQSALNLLVLIGVDTQNGFAMFGASDEAMRIQGGNSRLVEALVTALTSSFQVPIHTGHRLLGLSHQDNQFQLTFKTGNERHQVTAEHVVLAMPFSVLRHVHGIDRLGLSKVKQKSIAEWGYGTNSKQMIGFRSRFWRNGNMGVPANTGELFTDLPSQCYWETSRLQLGSSGILTNFLGGAAGREATSRQWQAALQDLDGLYKLPDAADAKDYASNQYDGNQAFFNWHHSPWAKGSYTCPKPGQYTTLMGSAQEPELNGRLFFAGEHCSIDWAGFMNGAVQSGNTAAQQVVDQLSRLPIGLSMG